MTKLRCAYVDLDGTLLGRGASLVHDGDGAFSLLGVRALEACDRAEVEVVPYSGRRRSTLFEDARLIGATSYVFEAGAGIVLDGETHWLTGSWEPSEHASIYDQIADSGAPALLLSHFERRLEYHAPWHVGREVSHLLRGEVDVTEAQELLIRHGHDDLRLVDNGVVRSKSDELEVGHPHAYHLVPREAGKANAVDTHMRMRGYERDECIAVGDSREDLGVAAVVSAFWLVANAVEKDPSLGIGTPPNVRIAEAAHGGGVYEAVISELAERR